MRLRKVSGLIFLCALVLSTCVTQEDANRAMARLDVRWKEENDRILDVMGKRSFSASKYQAFLASQDTFRRLGLFVRTAEFDSGNVYANAPAPLPLNALEWEIVKRNEMPNLHAIMVEELGSMGTRATLDTHNLDVIMNVRVRDAENAVEVSLTFAVQNKLRRVRSTEPPPSALRLALEKFWWTFDSELAATLANKSIPAEPPAQIAGAPSGPSPPRPSTPPTAPSGAIVSSGSGFIVSDTGVVLTNFHVIEGCNRFIVRTPAGDRVQARRVAADPANDLAALRITPYSGLTVARFRDGRQVRQGDGIVAMGFPLRGVLASQANLSVGYVSALAGIGNDSTLLQISAPIQPGNSGGPLIDMQGHIVGVVVASLSPLHLAKVTGTLPQNVNFAIKSEIARNFLDANDVKYQTAKPDKEIRPGEVADLARPFTVLVECSK